MHALFSATACFLFVWLHTWKLYGAAATQCIVGLLHINLLHILHPKYPILSEEMVP